MMRNSRTTRSDVTGLASSASALIALVAVAALMTSAPGLNSRIAPIEVRSALTEGQSARELAAAVAAAARELVGAERLVPQIATAPIDQIDRDSLALATISVHFDPATAHIIRSRVVAERLLDLPPPTC